MEEKIIIDPEFKALIPPLSPDEFEQLRLNLLQDGCRDAICVWGEPEGECVIIDGHNRFEICNKYNITYTVEHFNFNDREEVKDWIDTNQLGRRNLTPDQRRIIIGRRYNREKKSMAEAGSMKGKSLDKNCLSLTTSEKLAEEYNHHPNTIKNFAKDAEFFENLTAKNPELAKEVWGGETTLKDVKKEERKQELEIKKQEYKERIVSEEKSLSIDIFNPNDKYRIIYADPPWSYNDKCEGGGVQSGGVEVKYYDVMPTKDICDLPIKDLTEKDAVLFLWVTSPLLPDGLEVIRSWGFTYKSSFVWDKISHNMGHYNSVRHEFLLIATKGSCQPDNKKLYDSVQSIEKTEHSKKPLEFLNIIDDLYQYGNRIELFSRNKHDNWDVWGNEV